MYVVLYVIKTHMTHRNVGTKTNKTRRAEISRGVIFHITEDIITARPKLIERILSNIDTFNQGDMQEIVIFIVLTMYMVPHNIMPLLPLYMNSTHNRITTIQKHRGIHEIIEVGEGVIIIIMLENL